MPEINLSADEELDGLLDRVAAKYGMNSREDALEFLLRRRLRKGARRVTGRGRALYLTRENSREHT